LLLYGHIESSLSQAQMKAICSIMPNIYGKALCMHDTHVQRQTYASASLMSVYVPQGMSRILAVVGRELDQEHGRLAASHKSAESSFHAAKDEQQRYEAALSSIDPLLTQTLDKVKVAAKRCEHKCRVADAQEELDTFSAQLERQLTAFKDAVIEGIQEEFADRFSHLIYTV